MSTDIIVYVKIYLISPLKINSYIKKYVNRYGRTLQIMFVMLSCLT